MRVRTTEDTFQRARDSYQGRKYLYLFPHTSETFCAVNYDATNAELNTFLRLFDVWGTTSGQHKVSEDNNHQEVWFEVDEEFYQLAKHSRTFQRAIERMGVKIVFEYPFKKPEPNWSYDWKAAAKAVTEFKNVWSNGPDRWEEADD